jgi:putative transposase
MLNQVMARQLEMAFRTWGGKREGAGRKRRPGARPSVEHRPRAKHAAAHPVHVTLRARRGLPPFRERALFGAMAAAVRAANRSPAVGEAFRVVHFSVQSDHVHLIVEAHDGDTLARGMQGLAIRLAKRTNALLQTRGRVWGDRFHARELKTPRAVRSAIVYVLMNAKKHGMRVASGVDTFSSARWFDGFVKRLDPPEDACPVYASRTWLGAVGWRRRGLVRFEERPHVP